LQDGEINYSKRWENNGLTIRTEDAYADYEDFSKHQHAFRPDTKSVWSKKVRKVLGRCVSGTRQTQGNDRIRFFQFAPLADCRRQFAAHVGAPDIEWEPENDGTENIKDIGKTTTLLAPGDAPEPEPDFEWEPVEDEP
jgi:hypothetical protein